MLNVGDKVRIRQGKKLGETLWVITLLLPGMGCMIQEYGTPYACQRFDVSLLAKVDE